MTDDFKPTQPLLSEARRLWKDGHALEAGQLIFESLPAETRPRWAARVLRLAVDRTGVQSQAIERAIDIANTPSEWGKAHDAFDSLRDKTLELDQQGALSPEQTLLLEHLCLAELVAKVTYSATNPDDEFDEDSGWWIAPCLKHILDFVNDENFSRAAWGALALDEESA